MNFLVELQKSEQMLPNSRWEIIVLLAHLLIVVLTVNSAIAIVSNIVTMGGFLLIMHLRILNLEGLQEIPM